MYLVNFLIAFDQLANTVLTGEPDETISARCWRNRDKRYWKHFRQFVDLLFFIQKNHCYKSYLAEIHRKQFPKDYRDNFK